MVPQRCLITHFEAILDCNEQVNTFGGTIYFADNT